MVAPELEPHRDGPRPAAVNESTREFGLLLVDE
jgi:hypothetical protein